MPNYDYECKKCGVFEVFQSMTAKPLTACPKCKGRVKRLIGPGAGIIFKGSGFYCTDYKKPTAPSSEKGPACPGKKEGCNGCPNH
ncbi:MAG: FmdB family zinc ribbon protein [Deltaproteobacteria bacterium]